MFNLNIWGVFCLLLLKLMEIKYLLLLDSECEFETINYLNATVKTKFFLVNVKQR